MFTPLVVVSLILALSFVLSTKNSSVNVQQLNHPTSTKIPSAINRSATKTGIRHPIAAPALRCLPDLVKGIPVFLDIRDLAAETPRKRFHENPPLLAIIIPP
jgi:hypothetical protein